jgi:hypothetical protein
MKIDKKRVFGCLHACLKQEDNAIRIRTPAIDSSFLRSKKKKLAEIFFVRDSASRLLWWRGERKEIRNGRTERKEEI